MKNLVMLLALLLIIATAIYGHTGVALGASQSEGAIPQSGDLCGGTGGIGQIVTVGNNAFTIKRHDDGNNQIIHLTNQAVIQTSTGLISLSNLKKGESVTLVGGPNSDGSFSADTVVVCNGNQKNQPDQANSLTVRKENTEYSNIGSEINVLTVVLFGLIWFGFASFLRLKLKKSLVYLLFFTIFYIYLYKVLDYTLWQFQSLLLLKLFVPGLILRGDTVEQGLNLIPLVTLSLEDVRTSLLNILLMMPFGFGLPFITSFRMKKIVYSGMLFSIGIEFLQFITGYMANITFRVADINDVIFNTLGVAIGYVLFVRFVRTARRTFQNSKLLPHPIFRYIATRPQLGKDE